jgi:hypothetical protein
VRWLAPQPQQLPLWSAGAELMIFAFVLFVLFVLFV